VDVALIISVADLLLSVPEKNIESLSVFHEVMTKLGGGFLSHSVHNVVMMVLY